MLLALAALIGWGGSLPSRLPRSHRPSIMPAAFRPVAWFLSAGPQASFDPAFAVLDGQGMDVTDQPARYSIPTFTYAGPPQGPD
jgi:hypothetical protein